MAKPISTASPSPLSKCNKDGEDQQQGDLGDGDDLHQQDPHLKTERMAAVDLSAEDYYAQQARGWKFRSEVIFSIFLNISSRRQTGYKKRHSINKCDNVQIVLGA